MNEYLQCSPEVEAALFEGRPVIALESTIISHGMPYPQNVETALACQRIARENGAVPATCAILGGKLCAGLTEKQIDCLGRSGLAVIKASRRDIPLLLAQGLDGATTVAATMIIAQLAGISVFATGGIGGVHRGAEHTMDISADLEELANTPVCVVCAGAKSILDLGLTLEYLETRGVPVIGYRTNVLPAFFTATSPFPLQWRAESPKEIADAIAAAKALGYQGGMLVANPIPADWSMDEAVISAAIENALIEAEESGISGKAVTPFLLAKIKDLTGGKSLASNIELVYNNVRLAAQISCQIPDSRFQKV
ncbi:MAG: pseudouridine-5'-phosphate glycosidase [Clostridiales bacterium]|nr:pseudouridine-5'-phosphate glycosidase [Clostridiales bacterium]